MKKIFLIGTFLLIGAFILTFSIQSLDFSESQNSKVSADADKKEKSLPLEEAQKKVDFELVIPEAPEGFSEPMTRALTPPTEAVTDPEAIKNMTKIESFYTSKESKNKSIFVTQTNHEIIPMDPSTGEEIIPEIKVIDNKEIKFTECDCEPEAKIYWWNNGQQTTQIKVTGKVNEQKIENIIKKINSKEQ